MSKKINHLIIGIALDVFDYIGFGMIPFLADIVDMIGLVYFWRILGPSSLIAAVEFIPLLDGLPMFTALGAYSYLRGRK